MLFTERERELVHWLVQNELESWCDGRFWSEEDAGVLRNLEAKTRRDLTRWQAWSAGVREAGEPDGRTWTPATAENWNDLNEAYDQGRNFGESLLGLDKTPAAW